MLFAHLCGTFRWRYHPPKVGKGAIAMKYIAIFMALLVLVSCGIFGSSPPSTYIIFFRTENAQLTAEARQTIDQAASAIKATRPRAVAIASGHAGNLRLAEPRFTAVSTALQSKGVASVIIARASLPGTQAKVPPIGYERVEIILVAH